MTTLTVTGAQVGVTIARNGVISALRYLVADRGEYQRFSLVDDAPPFDTVPRQIYSSDCLDQGTNRNGFFQSPYGVLFEDQSIAFGNLTVLNCPPNSVFEVDTTGALTLAEIEEARRLRDQRNAFPLAPLPPPPPENGYLDPKVGGPGSGVTLKLSPAQIEEERRRGEAWLARRDGIGVRGPSFEQLETERLIAERRRAAEEAAGAAANAEMYARVAAKKAALEKSQAEATALLAKARHGK
jgi:hypothetical protein